MRAETLADLLGMATRGSLREPCSIDLLIESERPWCGDWVRLYCRVSNATEAWVEVAGRRVREIAIDQALTLAWEADRYREEFTVWGIGNDDVPRCETIVINPRWL